MDLIKRILRMSTFYDKVLIGLIIMAILGSYGYLTINAVNAKNDVVVIEQNGKVIFQTDLLKNGIYSFKFGNETGQLEVKDRKVRMLPMDRKICPEGVCSNTGWIDGAPKTIICLPNHLIVSYKTNKENNNSDIDGYVY